MARKKAKKKAPKKPIKKAAKKVAKKPAKKVVTKKVKKKPAKAARVAAKKPAPVVEVVKKTTIINPYLTFTDNCEQAFNFYRSVFGGEFGYIGRFKEMPPAEGQTMSPEEGELIMHVSLQISKETVLMGSDCPAEYRSTVVIGNNFSISISATSKEEADRFFNALSEGGQVTMPLANQFWGSYFGMLKDKFGIQWMVGFDVSQPG